MSLVRRTAGELAAMRRAGRVVAEMHEAIGAAIGPGVTTGELDAVGREVLDRRGRARTSSATTASLRSSAPR